MTSVPRYPSYLDDPSAVIGNNLPLSRSLDLSNMAGLSCYDTCPVDRRSRSIRLVRILESSNDSLIRCEMTSFELSSCPHYVAASYTWGLNRRSSSILVNNVPFAIPTSLVHYLNEKRQAFGQPYHWIDALCINQEDTEERNHQVGMMRDIYRQAAAVDIWLGPRTDYSDAAMDCIDGCGTFIGRMHATIRTTIRTFLGPSQCAAVLRLCQLPYWRRVWIVQEIILARRILIRYGNKMAEWSHLEATVECIEVAEQSDSRYHSPSTAAVLHSSAVRLVRNKRWLQNVTFTSKAQVLEYLLDTYQKSESSEPLDRIYGFLGIVDDFDFDGTDFSITPDYSIPRAQLLLLVYDWLQTVPVLCTVDAKLRFIGRLLKMLKVHSQDRLAVAARSKAVSGIQYPAPENLASWKVLNMISEDPMIDCNEPGQSHTPATDASSLYPT